MHSSSRWGLGAAFALALGVAPAFADVVFTDTTFNLANYSFSPQATSPAGTLSITSSSGVLQTTATFTNSATAINVAQGLVNNGFSYNPLTQGAITGIDTSVLKNISTDFTLTGGGNTFRPTVEQGGVFYLAAIAGATFNGPNAPGGTGFTNFSATGLQATDFLSYDFSTGTFGSANPNFAGGGTLLFGLTQISGVGSFSGSPGQLITQYQDLSFDIHAVPEPSTLLLFGATLLGLGWLYRRRRV